MIATLNAKLPSSKFRIFDSTNKDPFTFPDDKNFEKMKEVIVEKLGDESLKEIGELTEFKNWAYEF